MIVQFLLDGAEYNVSVLSLSRSFSIKDAIAASTTQDGNIYRDPIGTYYNYTMVVADKGDMAALDAFWEAISQPVASHVCVFPYNQQTLTQRMYVTTGTQPIRRLHSNGVEWGEIKINFTAQAPKVLV